MGNIGPGGFGDFIVFDDGLDFADPLGDAFGDEPSKDGTVGYVKDEVYEVLNIQICHKEKLACTVSCNDRNLFRLNEENTKLTAYQWDVKSWPSKEFGINLENSTTLERTKDSAEWTMITLSVSPVIDNNSIHELIVMVSSDDDGKTDPKTMMIYSHNKAFSVKVNVSYPDLLANVEFNQIKIPANWRDKEREEMQQAYH